MISKGEVNTRGVSVTSSPDKEKSIPRGVSVTSSPDKEKSIPRGGVCDIFTRQGEVNTTGGVCL